MGEGQPELARRSRELAEAALFAAWQRDGEKSAREELLNRYLPLARSLARRYGGAREPFDDLLQVASLGLLKAIDRFDADRGLRFSSFAVPTILGELKRYFRDTGWAVHVPRGAQERALELQRVQERLTTVTGRTPTVSELAEYMELSVEDVLDRLEAAAAHHTASLDAPVDDDEEDSSRVQVFGGEDPGFQRAEDMLVINRAAEELTPRERLVLNLRFHRDMTQTEIADEIGVSQMQVSRILRQTLERLREQAGAVEAKD